MGPTFSRPSRNRMANARVDNDGPASPFVLDTLPATYVLGSEIDANRIGRIASIFGNIAEGFCCRIHQLLLAMSVLAFSAKL